MENLNEAVKNFKKLAGQARGILEIADALESIASVQQAAKDANKKKELCYRDLEVIESKIAIENENLKFALAKVSDAEKSAELVIKQAEQKKSEILADAKQQQDKIIESKCAEKVSVETAISGLKSELSGVSAEIRSKEKELESLNKKVSEVRAHLKSLAEI